MIISIKNKSPYIFKIKNELAKIVIDYNYNKYFKNKKENIIKYKPI